MRLSHIAGMAVIDARVARQAGVATDVFVDPATARLGGLTVSHADGWLVQRIPAAYVYRLGPRGILVTNTLELEMSPPRLQDPRWVKAERMLGMEVLTEGGDRVGHIRDADLDNQTCEVKSYSLRPAEAAPWKRRSRIYPREIVSCSSELMIVRERQRSRRKAEPKEVEV
jgi:sporulation protein YlmC with PRC-barrel domain